MRYVAGFMYSDDYSKVALIRKLKPDWQKGKLNGVGGKVEFGEGIGQAMVREFLEETGYKTKNYDWRCFCLLSGNWGTVYFFTTNGDLSKLKSMEEEEVEIHEVSNIFNLDTIPNLRWLVPMGADKDKVGGTIVEFQDQ